MIKYTFDLTFLNPSEVSICFVEDLMSEIPDDPKLQEYVDYLVENNIREDGIFSPNIWVAFAADLSRTTINCKYFHVYFNALLYTAHLKMFTFIHV